MKASDILIARMSEWFPTSDKSDTSTKVVTTMTSKSVSYELIEESEVLRQCDKPEAELIIAEAQTCKCRVTGNTLYHVRKHTFTVKEQRHDGTFDTIQEHRIGMNQ